MDAKDIKRMMAISQRKQKVAKDAEIEFLTTIKKHLAKRGYRADLVLVANVKDTDSSFPVEVKYNTQLGYPSEKDLMSVVAKHFPKKSIDWDTVLVDTDTGTIMINLEPSVEVIPIDNLSKIPPEFEPVGTAIYKRAADASGDTNEIWELHKDDSGLVLRRKNDDMEVVAENENEFSAGSVVDTPYGPGKIVRFNEFGDAIVLIGSKKRLIAADELRPYNVDKEKKKLEDYYAQAYGDRNFAQALVKEYDTK